MNKLNERLEARVSFLPLNRLTSQPIPTPVLLKRRLFTFSSRSTKISHPILTSTKTAAAAQNVLPLSSLKSGEGQNPTGTLPHPVPARRPVSCPHGFCLTDGVSFLQRYDPGLVVVMVNLAVVIFIFRLNYSFVISAPIC